MLADIMSRFKGLGITTEVKNTEYPGHATKWLAKTDLSPRKGRPAQSEATFGLRERTQVPRARPSDGREGSLWNIQGAPVGAGDHLRLAADAR